LRALIPFACADCVDVTASPAADVNIDSSDVNIECTDQERERERGRERERERERERALMLTLIALIRRDRAHLSHGLTL